MTDAMFQVVELADKLPELKDALQALSGADEKATENLIAIADANGIQLTEQDVLSYSEEVSDDDLDDVSGGSLRDAYNDLKKLRDARG